jgi:large subunit ribosomal protein L35
MDKIFVHGPQLFCCFASSLLLDRSTGVSCRHPNMAHAVRPLTICSRCLNHRSNAISSLIPSFRSLSTGQSLRKELQQNTTEPEASPPPLSRPVLDPNLVSTASQEARLLKHQKLVPIGSRRRRAAVKSTANVPFEQLPYQCFQEARKVLAEDRAEKVKQIETQRARIARLAEQDPAVSGGEASKQRRLDSMRRELERLKILADINDPMVKKRFEDGDGMSSSFPTVTLRY